MGHYEAPKVSMTSNRKQAWDIVKNAKDISQVSKGNKVLSFADNLVNPDSVCVTIDRHMMRVMEGCLSASTLEDKKLSNREYQQLVGVVQVVSHKYASDKAEFLASRGVSTVHGFNVQAVTWVAQLLRSNGRFH
jgi:hypothetical protein